MKRLSFILLLCAIVSVASAQKITHTFQDVTLSDALKYIQTQATDYNITFIYDELEDFRVTTHVQRKSVPDAILQIVGFYPVRVVKSGDHEIYVECTHKTDRHLTGTIIDEQGQPVAYANIAVLNPADSTLLSGGVSNESGYFAIPYEQEKALARISYVGYKTLFVMCSKSDMGVICIQPESQMLKGITIKGHFIKQTNDGLNVTIENSPLAGLGYATDVLKQMPFVNTNGERIEIVGKGTPLIFINNRQVRDNSELKQLNSSDIKSIKLIINPGSEYDATVNAIIRIITKIPTGEGFSGIAEGNLYTERCLSHNASVSLNYRKRSLDIFGTFSYYRNLYKANQVDANSYKNWLVVDSLRQENRQFTFFTTLGTNYQWNERSSAGIRYRYTGTPNSHSSFFDRLHVMHNDVNSNKLNSTDQREKTSGVHYVNAYCDYGFSADSYLKIDMDYLNTRTTNDQDYHIGNGKLESRNEAKNQLYAGRLQFVTPLCGGTIKIGFEASYTNNDNQNIVADDATIENSLYSTANIARQNLYAGFLDYSRSWGEHWSANLGARYEYTDFDYSVDGVKSDEASKKYAGLFPSASLSYRNGGVGFSLSYRYTTNRPSYRMLRSAIAINNPYSYEGGNPTLQPTKTNMLTLTFSWKDLQLMASYTTYKDCKISVQDMFEDSDSITFFQPRDLDNSEFVLAVYYSPTLFRIWKPKFSINVTKPHQSYNGLSYNKPICDFGINNLINIAPTFQAGCDMSYHTSGHMGTCYFYSNFHTDIYFIKTFWNEKLRLNLKVTNLFNTNYEKWRMVTNGITLEKWNDGGRRTLWLSATFRFNPSKSKYKGTASTNELNRL